MSQFKRFNASENRSYNSSSVYPAGTLTWDPDSGLRLHDGGTSGGNYVGVSSFWDLSNRPSGTSALFDLIGGSGSSDNGKAYIQTQTGQANWGYTNILEYNGKRLTVLEGGALQLANGGTIDNQQNVDHIVGGATIQLSDLAFAVSGSPSATPTNDGFTNDGWQYLAFNDETLYNTVTAMTGTSTGYWPVTWAEGSTQRTGYVIIQFLGGFQFQICPIVNATDGNNTPVSGTWKFPANIRGSVVNNSNFTFNVSSEIGNATYALGDNGYISLPAGGSISDYDAGEGDSSIGSSLTGTGYSQIYWDGAPGTGNPYNGSDLFTWMYVDNTGITLGYANAGESKDFEWKFNTAGNLTLPAGGDIKDSNGASVLPANQVRYEMQSSSFTASAGKTYWIDSTSGALTVTLPASPTTGDWVVLYDAELKWQTNNLTVSGNGNNIRVITMGGSPSWGSPASTATLNQPGWGPTGPLPNRFVWNGTVWSGAM